MEGLRRGKSEIFKVRRRHLGPSKSSCSIPLVEGWWRGDRGVVEGC